MRAYLGILIVALIAAIALAEGGKDCFDKDLKLTIKDGDVAHPKEECLRLRCYDGVIETEPCEFAIPPDCVVVDGEKGKPFPSCCPTIKCD